MWQICNEAYSQYISMYKMSRYQSITIYLNTNDIYWIKCLKRQQMKNPPLFLCLFLLSNRNGMKEAHSVIYTTHTYKYLYTCTHMFIYVCMHVYTFISIHIHSIIHLNAFLASTFILIPNPERITWCII